MEKFLSTLNSNSAIGSDDISSCVLKKPAQLLLHILVLLFSPYHLPEVISHRLGNQQTSLHYIKMCKKMIPLTTDLSAYFQSARSARSWHPSSQLMKSFPFFNGLISYHQFGFKPCHSTLDMLLLLFQQWMEALNVSNEIMAVFLDISRAFDTVCHPALLSKLCLWHPK